jgi:RNA polymerase sigma-70 factor, ECF subfamily
MDAFPGMTNEQLLARYAETRQSSLFDELTRRLWLKLVCLERRVVHDNQHAEDVAQESLIVLARKPHLFHGRSTIYSWLGRVTINRAIERMRYLGRRHRVWHSLPEFVFDGSPDMKPNDAKERRDELIALIDSLPPIFRQVITMLDLDEMKYEDAARLLKVPVGTIRSRRHRAMNMLRKAVA